MLTLPRPTQPLTEEPPQKAAPFLFIGSGEPSQGAVEAVGASSELRHTLPSVDAVMCPERCLGWPFGPAPGGYRRMCWREPPISHGPARWASHQRWT